MLERDQLFLVVMRTIDDACLAETCHADFIAAAVIVAIVTDLIVVAVVFDVVVAA